MLPMFSLRPKYAKVIAFLSEKKKKNATQSKGKWQSRPMYHHKKRETKALDKKRNNKLRCQPQLFIQIQKRMEDE